MSHHAVTAALAAAALAFPATAAASSVHATAHLETAGVAHSATAVSRMRGHVAKARADIHRSEAALQHAYVHVDVDAQQSPAAALGAVTQFTSAAADQAANLASIVAASQGTLESVAAGALAKTATMDATLVSGVSDEVDAQDSNPTPVQGQELSSIGADQAGLSASVATSASTDDLQGAVQHQLVHAAALSVQTQATLIAAATDLRARVTDAVSGALASLLSHLQTSGSALAATLAASSSLPASGHLSLETSGLPLSMLLEAEISLIG